MLQTYTAATSRGCDEGPQLELPKAESFSVLPKLTTACVCYFSTAAVTNYGGLELGVQPPNFMLSNHSVFGRVSFQRDIFAVVPATQCHRVLILVLV